jgi:hypothetical protein
LKSILDSNGGMGNAGDRHEAGEKYFHGGW